MQALGFLNAPELTDQVWSIAKDNSSSLTKPGMLLTILVLSHQQHSCSDLLLHTQHSFNCTVRKTINVPCCKYADCQNRTSYRELLRTVLFLVSTPPTGGYVYDKNSQGQQDVCCLLSQPGIELLSAIMRTHSLLDRHYEEHNQHSLS